MTFFVNDDQLINCGNSFEKKMLLPGCQIKVMQKYDLDDATDKLANSILTDWKFAHFDAFLNNEVNGMHYMKNVLFEFVFEFSPPKLQIH